MKASSLHKCSIRHQLRYASIISVWQGRAMIGSKRRLWRACIILSASITLSILIYFNYEPRKAVDNLAAKFVLSSDLMWARQPKMDILDTFNHVKSTRVVNTTFSTTPIKNTTITSTTECSNNYILSVWNQPVGAALGNKMSDYASLIGHARKLQLRPFIMPSMRDELSKIFR